MSLRERRCSDTGQGALAQSGRASASQAGGRTVRIRQAPPHDRHHMAGDVVSHAGYAGGRTGLQSREGGFDSYIPCKDLHGAAVEVMPE